MFQQGLNSIYPLKVNTATMTEKIIANMYFETKFDQINIRNLDKRRNKKGMF